MRSILLALLLGACSSTQLANLPIPLSGPNSAVTSLNTFTVNDLQTAAQIATAAGDSQGALCFGFLTTQLQAQQKALAGVSPTAGVATAFEIAHLGTNAALTAINPLAATSMQNACGPYFLNVMGGLNAIISKLGGTALAIP